MLDRKKKYFGINDKGYGELFDTMEELESAGYTFATEMYKLRLATISKEELDKLPKLTAEPPKFNISFKHSTIVKP